MSKPKKQQSDARITWDEYSYRHAHIWKVVFQLTIAVVALSMVPYLPQEKARALINLDISTIANLSLVPPAIAFALCALGLRRLYRELRRFKRVKAQHLMNTDRAMGRSTFSGEVLAYVGVLCLGSLLHVLFLIATRLSG